MLKARDKTKPSYWIMSAIGLACMLFASFVPNPEPITPIGMEIVMIFIGVIFLWSAVGNIWPSILGIVMVGLSGYLGEGAAGVTASLVSAFGSSTVFTIIFAMILFGGVAVLGFAKYIARFFLSLKIQEGRPYVFLFFIMFCSYLVTALSGNLSAILLMFPVVIDVLEKTGYKKGDKAWYSIILGVFFATAVGQPTIPFGGGLMLVLAALQTTLGTSLDYMPLLGYAILMGTILILTYLVFLKIFIRPDFSGIKALRVDDIKQETLPPLNIRQRIYLIVFITYMLCVIVPPVLPFDNIIITTLTSMGAIGCALTGISILELVKINGQSVLAVRESTKVFSWDVYFIVPAGTFLSGLITNADLGVIEFLQVSLDPIFGGQLPIVFILLLVAIAIIFTQFAGNVPTAYVLFPIAAAFAAQYPSLNMTAICILVAYAVFVALCLPAASPFSAILHSRKDLVSFKEIQKVYIPLIVVVILVYATAGYFLANAIFG